MELKKKLVLAICSGNIVILAIFLWAWKMTQTDKEKLRMAKNLVKSNNKKIKKALDHINRFLAEREENKNELPIFLADITDIKEILEEWNSLV